MEKYVATIIVPMYKVEHFIERCCRQLFEQTLENVEFLFIDDCSPDRCSEIVKEMIALYPQRKEHTRIIRHEQNKGLPSARNTGLKVAQGDYIFHCDGDDWIEINALELMYEKAMTENVEIVYCDWYLSFRRNERTMKQPNCDSPQSAIKAMLGGSMKYNVWNKLIARSLYWENNITFPDGYGMGEDLTIFKLFAVANRIKYLNVPLYHYVQQNNEAYTKKTTQEHLKQLKHNVEDVINYLYTRYGNIIFEDIEFFKLNIKLPFLISNSIDSYTRWLEWFPESNFYINKNPMFNWRTRFIQWAAMNRLFWINRIYYFIVVHIYYGFLYK